MIFKTDRSFASKRHASSSGGKKEKTLRHMDPVYFFPNFDRHREEMELRGMSNNKGVTR